MRATIAFLAAAMATPPVSAAPGAACHIYGYNADTDMGGTNIRNAPDANAPVIGKLMPEHGEDGIYGAEFEIIGSKNGWLLIRNALTNLYGEGDAKTAFKGPGWISGGLVGFTINDYNMRADPSLKAKITHVLMEAESGAGPDAFAVKRVYACSGEFADVKVQSPEGTVYRGWVTSLCSNQRTTCP